MSGTSKCPKQSSPHTTLSAPSSQVSSSSLSTSSSSRKRLRRGPRSGSSTSSSFNNDNGKREVDNRLRSVLCHRLGLPLVRTFHGLDPGTLEYLRQESQYFSSDKYREWGFAKVLETAVGEWQEGTLSEGKLTKLLVDTINGEIPLVGTSDGYSKIPLNANGQEESLDPDKPRGIVDMVLYAENGDRPLMVVEVGLSGVDWWKKVDHGIKYVTLIRKRQKPTDNSPLLLAIMTIDYEESNMTINDETQSGESNKSERFVVKLGVFLCLWNNENNDQVGDEDKTIYDVRLSLLWHTKTNELKGGSEAFGHLLRGVCDFSSWIAKEDVKPNESKYTYYSSSCCRVDDEHVLRSYDTRFRDSTRSPDIYLSGDCQAIVGEGAREIFTLPSYELLDNDDSDPFWNSSRKQLVQVIVTPYRPGVHYATKPKLFLQIIEQLEKLHEKGFVHGDIRGFNIVFDNETEQAYLIDFDFGGKPGRKYPEGYVTSLHDGSRLVDHGTQEDKSPNIIRKWHDWYALGRLIFEFHDFVAPEGTERKTEYLELVMAEKNVSKAWSDLKNDPTTKKMNELKEFLQKTQKEGWKVEPRGKFQSEITKIENFTNSKKATNPCATGSPLKKKF